MPVSGIRESTTVTNRCGNAMGNFRVTVIRSVTRFRVTATQLRAAILLRVNTEKGPHDVDYPLIHGAAACRVACGDSTPL